MPEIQGLILAAGRGSRLGSRSEEVPKCLLQIGRRRLIEYQLEDLAAAGVGPVAMVLGYCADEIREAVGIRAEFLHNPRWDATNSLYSFSKADEWVKGPLLIVNCDVLFSPQVLERLLAVKGDAIAIDSSSGDAREQMKVKVEDGRIVDMRKDLPVEQSDGENVGILKLTAESARALFEKAETLIAAGEGDKAWLGSAVRELAQTRRLQAVDVAGVPWVEIDFPVDLVRARKQVLPAIRAERRRRRPIGRIARFLSAAAVVLAVALVALGSGGATPVRSEGHDWETILLSNTAPETVRVGDRNQTWWRIEGERGATATVLGPGPVRIESRLLGVREENVPYVLAVHVDGERHDWFKHDTRPSGKATHERFAIGHKERITLELPPGEHRVEVFVIAPGEEGCLVRFRCIEDEEEEQEEEETM